MQAKPLLRDNLRSMLEETNYKKTAGKSCIMLSDGRMQTFVADDPSASEQSAALVDELTAIFKIEFNYNPDLSCVLMSFETEQEKEHNLMRHSEKLAIATALLDTKLAGAITVTKNLRMCGDCHTFAKYVSLHCKRTLNISDRAFKHVFSNGKCSCGDKY